MATSVLPGKCWISKPNAVAVAFSMLVASVMRARRATGLSSDSRMTNSSMKGGAPTGMFCGSSLVGIRPYPDNGAVSAKYIYLAMLDQLGTEAIQRKCEEDICCWIARFDTDVV